MHQSDKQLLTQALEHTVAALVLVENVIEGPESPPTGSDLDLMDRASFELEAGRAALRAILGLPPATDLPVGHPHRASMPPASTGSRRSTPVDVAQDEYNNRRYR